MLANFRTDESCKITYSEYRVNNTERIRFKLQQSNFQVYLPKWQAGMVEVGGNLGTPGGGNLTLIKK